MHVKKKMTAGRLVLDGGSHHLDKMSWNICSKATVEIGDYRVGKA